MPQTVISFVDVGGRSQDTCASCLNTLFWGTSLETSADRTWLLCWRTACWSRITSPSPTGLWWSGSPSSQNLLLSTGFFWVLKYRPAQPSCSSQHNLVWLGAFAHVSWRQCLAGQVCDHVTDIVMLRIFETPFFQSRVWLTVKPTPQPSQWWGRSDFSMLYF